MTELTVINIGSAKVIKGDIEEVFHFLKKQNEEANKPKLDWSEMEVNHG